MDIFWKRLPECLDTGLEHGITRSLISSPNHLTTTPLTAKSVLQYIFTVAKQIGFHVSDDTLCGEADKSRSYRSEGLGSNPVHCNFVSLLSTPQGLGHSSLY